MRSPGHSHRRSASLLALALTAPACTLFDTRPELQILPTGTLRAGPSLTVTVQGAAGGRAQLYVDGETLGDPVQVGAAATVDTSALAEGTRGLVARLVAASEPRASAASTLIVDHTPPSVATLPPSIVTDASRPLLIELRFSEPIDPDSLVLVARSPYVPAVPVTQGLSVDRMVVTLRVEPPLDVYGAIWLDGTAADQAGNAVPIHRVWQMPGVDVAFAKPTPGSYVGGVVQVQADASPSVTQGVLLVNGVEVGALGPSPWNVNWDSTGFAEGLAVLEIRVPGRFVRGGKAPVYIDNTPPRLTNCGNPRPVDPWVGECVVFAFNEDVTLANPVLTVGATTVPSELDGMFRTWFVCPIAGSSAPVLEPLEKVALVEVRDRAGLGGSVTCSVPLRPVRRPWGDGPLLAAGSFPGSLALAASMEQPSFRSYVDRVSLFGAGPPGTSGAAPIVRVDGSAPGPWRSPVSFVYDPAAAASDVRYAYPYYPWRSILAWVERRGDGPGLARFRWIENAVAAVADFPPLNADTSRDARDLSLYLDNGRAIAAWSEETDGGRAIRVKDVRFSEQSFVGGAVSDPLAVAERPWASIYGPGTGPAVAFLETAPSGVPQVRAAGWTGSEWLALGLPANLDMVSPAADPVLGSSGGASSDFFFLAWVEAGRVLARRWDPYALLWGPAEVLNTDPARQARSLRGCQEPLLAFVEATAGGDEIQARLWDGIRWSPMPGPGSDGYLGPIADFTISCVGGLGVAWTDPQGQVYLRVYQ